MIDPSLLDRGHVIGASKPFDRSHLTPDVSQCHLTRADSFAINMHGAGPTGGHATAEFCAGQADLIAQDLKQGHIFGQIYVVRGTIDRQAGSHCIAPFMNCSVQFRITCHVRQRPRSLASRCSTYARRSPLMSPKRAGILSLKRKNPCVACGQAVLS